MFIYELSGCGFESRCSQISEFAPVLSKEFLDIQATMECGFTLIRVRDMIRTYSQKTLLLVIVYRAPGPVGSFIDKLILLMNELPIQHRILIVGDFNHDQMLPENVANITPLIQSFDLSQRSQYSTHIHGGILDLIFDFSNSNIVSVLPSPYSDHFVLFFQI